MKKILLPIFCIIIATPAFADCQHLMFNNDMNVAYNNCRDNEMRMQRQESMMQQQLNLQRQQVQMQQQWMNQQRYQPMAQPVVSPAPRFYY